MRTSNPALSEKTFRDIASSDHSMTIQGTVNKSLLLILIVYAGAHLTWLSAPAVGEYEQTTLSIPDWYLPTIFITFILGMVIIFKKTTAPFLAPVYAFLEGATLGVLSSIFEMSYPGIIIQAVMCTLGTFAALLLAYKSGLIRATENFKLGVVAATGGIALVYLASIILSFFGASVPFLHDSGPIGIGVSVFITIVAALNLVLDFDFIEQGAESGAPKYMEWYASFGLLVTLVWLYLEFLRLLSKSRRK